jgi:uncharacterized protein involved in type VI secretion and phage assembly
MTPKFTGVMIGLVTDNKHEKGEYRVKVKFPFLAEQESSCWARVISWGAGKADAKTAGTTNQDETTRGLFCLPEVNDEVLVAFAFGDFQQPFVIGTLWNGVDKVVYKTDSGDPYKAKRFRAFYSRFGHFLEFDDNGSNTGKVTLKSQRGTRVVLDDENQKIELYDHEENNYVLVDNKSKKITVESKTGDMLLKAKNTIRLEAKTIELKSDKDTEMKAGANFKAEASSNMTLKANGQGEINMSGTLTIKGSTVNIN